MFLRDLLLDSPDHVQEYIRGLFTKLPFQLCELWIYRPEQELLTCQFYMLKTANGEIRHSGLRHEDKRLNELSCAQGPLWDQMSRNFGNPVEYISDTKDTNQQGFSIYSDWLKSQGNQFEIIESVYGKFLVANEVKQIFGLKDLALVRIFDEHETAENETIGDELVGIIRMFNLTWPDKSQKPTPQQVVLAILQIIFRRSFATLASDSQRSKVKDFGSVITDDGTVKVCTVDPNMQKILEDLRKAARTDDSILLSGETGTGKEIIAQWIHQNSPRKAKLFLPFSISDLNPTLIETGLFGSVKGAFTGALDKKGVFETAGEGTVLIDEIGDMPLELQAKLLRVLESRKFSRVGDWTSRSLNARVIAATWKDLEELVRRNEFRADLYFRLNVFPTRLLPLRERKDDLPLILDFLLEQSKTAMMLSDEVRSELLRRPWPGNFRELNYFLRSLRITAENLNNVTMSDLRNADRRKLGQNGDPLARFDPSDALIWAHNHKMANGLKASVLDIVKVRLVQKAIEMQGNVKRAHEFLGAAYNTVKDNRELYEKYFGSNGNKEGA